MDGAEKGSSLESNVEFNLAPDLTTALGTLAEKVGQFAADHSIGGEVSYRLNLVLDELVTNCLNYALSEVAEPKLLVRLSSTPHGVVAQLEDNGAPFDPFRDAPKPDTSLALDERPVGGLGVFFVTRCTDNAGYERKDGVNRITLRIRSEP